MDTDQNFNGFDEDFPRQRLHLSRKSRGKEDGLSVGPYSVHNEHDLRLESHVEHAISLVQHDVRGAPQIRHTSVVGREHFNHPSGCADDNFAALLQLGNLLGDAGAAVHAHRHEVHGFGEFLGLLVDLQGQFAGRSADQRDRPFALL